MSSVALSCYRSSVTLKHVWMQLLLSEMKSKFTVRNLSCLYLPVRWYWTRTGFGGVEQRTYPSNSLKSLSRQGNFSKDLLKYLSLMLKESFGCYWLRECFKYDWESKSLLNLLIDFFFPPGLLVKMYSYYRNVNHHVRLTCLLISNESW